MEVEIESGPILSSYTAWCQVRCHGILRTAALLAVIVPGCCAVLLLTFPVQSRIVCQKVPAHSLSISDYGDFVPENPWKDSLVYTSNALA